MNEEVANRFSLQTRQALDNNALAHALVPVAPFFYPGAFRNFAAFNVLCAAARTC
jgi:hypothetical protein